MSHCPSPPAMLRRAFRKREMAPEMRLSAARRRRAVMLMSRKQQKITVLRQHILPPVLRYRITAPAPDKQNGAVKPPSRVQCPVPLDKFPRRTRMSVRLRYFSVSCSSYRKIPPFRYRRRFTSAPYGVIISDTSRCNCINIISIPGEKVNPIRRFSMKNKRIYPLVTETEIKDKLLDTLP